MSLAPVTIKLDNVGKKFNTEWIFRNLTRSFEPGNTYAIVGPNGGGKSTLLQLLWGQTLPSSGTVEHLTASKKIDPDEVFRHLSIATPYMDLIDEFTLEEQVDFHFKLRKPRAGMQPLQMIDRMYLHHARKKFISNFSSGMRQRVKLALAFYTEASMIFLDEPGTNLDAQAFEWYVNELSQVPSQCMIFIASNQTAEYPLNAQKIDIMSYK